MYRGVTRYGTNQKGNFNNGVSLVFIACCPSCSLFQLSLATHLNNNNKNKQTNINLIKRFLSFHINLLVYLSVTIRLLV